MSRNEALALHDFVALDTLTFEMGSEQFDIEAPVHAVTVASFEIDRWPVTNQQYLLFAQETGQGLPPDFPHDNARARHPVERVQWQDAVAYAAWIDARLPTEAEWERASRGAEGRVYPWGDEFDEEHCIVWDNARVRGVTTVSVDDMLQGATSEGVRHLAGNVEEWVDGVFLAYPGARHTSPYAEGECRTLRGGSWFFTHEYARGSARRGALPDYDGFSGGGGPGFRCARDVRR